MITVIALPKNQLPAKRPSMDNPYRKFDCMDVASVLTNSFKDRRLVLALFIVSHKFRSSWLGLTFLL